ncbi:uncharacterized protein LOC135847620 [Planococcus citri]|uniref:uncharacterized protein LOC135847620 n=1 Tax=Planococcus citri TaxID=170843 RepID=UPI0031F97CDB
MAGITSDVYDVFHPTPVSLKQLSAIVVSLEVWRYKTNEYRNNGKLEDFNPPEERILLKNALPGLPSEIYDVIDKNVRKFGFSMYRWLSSHHERVFYFHYKHRNHVLEYFEDFVCDYNGAIHYVRTAERMMLCDQFNMQQKFTIACTYFFEDEIRRLWPLVSGNKDFNHINFCKSPQLCYWICCLKNELYKLPTVQFNDSVAEVMLNYFMPFNRPSVEYFWNRIPSESRMRKAIDIYNRSIISFARFILPKLNDQQLGEFLNEKCYVLMYSLFRWGWYDEEFILSTWMRIQNWLNEYAAADLFTKILLLENRPVVYGLRTMYEVEKRPFDYRNWYRFCCKLWNSASEKLKQSAVKVITSKRKLFKRVRRVGPEMPTKEYKFLSTVLSYARYEERKTFWNYHWPYLVNQTRCKDFEKIMKLCLEKEDEITHFKQNVMAPNSSFRKLSNEYLRCARFDHLNDYANFLWPDIPTSRIQFKQEILQSVLSNEKSFFGENLLNKAKEFDVFISNAYGDVDLSKNYKNQLMSSPGMQIRLGLPNSALHISVDNFLEFIDTFVSNEETLLQIKASIIDYLKEKAAIWKGVVPESSFMSLLSWCLGNDEEAAKCKPSYL